MEFFTKLFTRKRLWNTSTDGISIQRVDPCNPDTEKLMNTTEKGRNPKDIIGPLKEINGIGWKFVHKNKEMLFGKNMKSPQKKIDEI